MQCGKLALFFRPWAAKQNTTFPGMLLWANFTAVHNIWDYKRVSLAYTTHLLFPISTSLGTHSHDLDKNQQTNDQVHMTDNLGILNLTA